MAVESRGDLASRHGRIGRIAEAHSWSYRSDNPICTRTPIIHRDANYPENLIMPDHALTWSKIGARAMPPKPTWFHRLPEILDVLRSIDSSNQDCQDHSGGARIAFSLEL